MLQQKEDILSQWYIVYREKSSYQQLEDTLRGNGIEYFLPKMFIEEYNEASEEMMLKDKLAIRNLVFIKTLEDIKEVIQRTPGIRAPYIDCSTKTPATVSDAEMKRFTFALSQRPENIDFLKNPYRNYSGNVKVRVKDGPYKGYEGYLVRIRGDRKLVIAFGQQALSISGIHISLMEVIEQSNH